MVVGMCWQSPDWALSSFHTLECAPAHAQVKAVLGRWLFGLMVQVFLLCGVFQMLLVSLLK